MEHCISRSTSVTSLTEHNNPIPFFLEQDIPFVDDAVPLIRAHVCVVPK